MATLQANQVLEHCTSTNTHARELAEVGYPHGTWISARKQTAGRGRRGNLWESPEGNLFLSIVLRLKDPSLYTWLPLSIGTSTCALLSQQFPQLDFKIKWPNDLWIGTHKLGGILCEGNSSGQNAYVIAGLGLNCLHSPMLPEALGSPTNLTSQLRTIHAEVPCSPDILRASIITAILDGVFQLEHQGSTAVLDVYQKFALFQPGSALQWGSEGRPGTVVGLGPSGELEVRAASGELFKLYSEEVSLVRKIIV